MLLRNLYFKVLQKVHKTRVKFVRRLRSNTIKIKQLTGIYSVQYRKFLIQINHIACAMLPWLKLKKLAAQAGQNIYKIKRNLLSNYLIRQLKRPDVHMCLV